MEAVAFVLVERAVHSGTKLARVGSVEHVGIQLCVFEG